MAGYADRAALIADATFMGRLNACVANEAKGKPSDAFVDTILRAWGWGGQAFGPLVVSSPGFDKDQADITDGDILAATQANWAQAQALSGLTP